MRNDLNFRANLALGLIFAFLVNIFGPIPLAYADELTMPQPGVLVHLSPEYTPALLKGIVIHPENAFKFDFIVYKGDKEFSGSQKKEEYTKLIKYFLASLAVPDEDQWVNLSPYEKNRIIKDDFGKTEMGRDLLAQDYLLKQITASLIYPQDKLGRKFWDEVYARAYKQFGTTNIPVNTFNKVWIIPDDADIYEKGNVAYLYKSHLKVMLEEDYLSLQKHSGVIARSEATKQSLTTVDALGSQIVRSIILPQLEKEVNEDKNFAPLRQVFSGMILAAWYKRALRESLLSQIYANKAKVKGVDQDPQNNEAIYQQYLIAYKKGVFNYIKEDVDKYTNETIPRKYFSGGFAPNFKKALHLHLENDKSAAMAAQEVLNHDSASITYDLAEVSVDPDQTTNAVKKPILPNAAMTAKFWPFGRTSFVSGIQVAEWLEKEAGIEPTALVPIWGMKEDMKYLVIIGRQERFDSILKGIRDKIYSVRVANTKDPSKGLIVVWHDTKTANAKIGYSSFTNPTVSLALTFVEPEENAEIEMTPEQAKYLLRNHRELWKDMVISMKGDDITLSPLDVMRFNFQPDDIIVMRFRSIIKQGNPANLAMTGSTRRTFLESTMLLAAVIELMPDPLQAAAGESFHIISIQTDKGIVYGLSHSHLKALSMRKFFIHLGDERSEELKSIVKDLLAKNKKLLQNFNKEILVLQKMIESEKIRSISFEGGDLNIADARKAMTEQYVLIKEKMSKLGLSDRTDDLIKILFGPSNYLAVTAQPGSPVEKAFANIKYRSFDSTVLTKLTTWKMNELGNPHIFKDKDLIGISLVLRNLYIAWEIQQAPAGDKIVEMGASHFYDNPGLSSIQKLLKDPTALVGKIDPKEWLDKSDIVKAINQDKTFQGSLGEVKTEEVDSWIDRGIEFKFLEGIAKRALGHMGYPNNARVLYVNKGDKPVGLGGFQHVAIIPEKGVILIDANELRALSHDDQLEYLMGWIAYMSQINDNTSKPLPEREIQAKIARAEFLIKAHYGQDTPELSNSVKNLMFIRDKLSKLAATIQGYKDMDYLDYTINEKDVVIRLFNKKEQIITTLTTPVVPAPNKASLAKTPRSINAAMTGETNGRAKPKREKTVAGNRWLNIDNLIRSMVFTNGFPGVNDLRSAENKQYHVLISVPYKGQKRVTLTVQIKGTEFIRWADPGHYKLALIQEEEGKSEVIVVPFKIAEDYKYEATFEGQAIGSQFHFALADSDDQLLLDKFNNGVEIIRPQRRLPPRARRLSLQYLNEDAGEDKAMKGGIDMNAANLNMHIKRDGSGVPLPVGQQELGNIHIDGLVPVILDIIPASASPILSQLTSPSPA